jgi:DNA-binding MarR family transcriptional regulator
MKAKKSEPSIPYLVHRIAVRIEDSINTKARKYGLRIGEIRILMRLLHGGDLRVGELAQMTSIEVSALSHILRRMGEAGWVTRTRAAKDSRLVLVSLTEKGRKLASLLRPYIRRYNDLAIRRIPAADIVVVREVLARIYENVVGMEDAMPEFPDISEAELRLAGD